MTVKNREESFLPFVDICFRSPEICAFKSWFVEVLELNGLVNGPSSKVVKQSNGLNTHFIGLRNVPQLTTMIHIFKSYANKMINLPNVGRVLFFPVLGSLYEKKQLQSNVVSSHNAGGSNDTKKNISRSDFGI